MPSLCADKSGGIPKERKHKWRVWGEFCGTEAHSRTFSLQQSKNHGVIKCWYLFCLNFSLFSLRNYPWCLHPMSFKRGSIACSHRRGWLAPLLLHPPFPPSSSLQYTDHLELTQRQKRHLSNIVKRCQAQTGSQSNRTVRANLTVTPCYCRVASSSESSLQTPAAQRINEPKVHKDCVNISP